MDNPKYQCELAEVPPHKQFIHDDELYETTGGWANTRFYCIHIESGKEYQVSSYATVKVWEDFHTMRLEAEEEFNKTHEKCPKCDFTKAKDKECKMCDWIEKESKAQTVTIDHYKDYDKWMNETKPEAVFSVTPVEDNKIKITYFKK